MQEADKRKYLRKVRDKTFCVIDDIESHFAVVEISAHGFSFACEKNDDRFKENRKLGDISILNSESQEIVHASGTVMHRSSFDTFHDRIGVLYESKKLDNTITGKVRLPRKQPSIDLTVEVNGGEKKTTGKVLDYNVRSVRLLLDKSPNLFVGDEVALNIGTNAKRLYCGNGTVIRTGDTEIVVQFTEKLLEVKFISVSEKAIYTRDIIGYEEKKFEEFAVVSAPFKALIADWRIYFEAVERILNQEQQKEALSSEDEERHFIEEIEPLVFRRLREFITKLNELAEKIEPELVDTYKKYFRAELERFIRRSPLACSIIDKIHGYHGDFETVKQFFGNPYRGATLFGKLINKFITSLEPVTAHVDRIEYLYREILTHYNNADKELRILSLGSGPAQEILQLLEWHEPTKPITIALVDSDAYALADFYERIQYFHRENVHVDLVNFNIINILIGKGPDLRPESYDITYCAGMFDYFKDRFCRKFVEFLIGLTRPGGNFYYTNVHSRNFARYFMDFGGGWEIYHRDENQTIALAPSNYQCEAHFDDTGTNIYIKGTTPEL